jgi:ADP-heptose:LPS heptosyltransferase
MMAAGSLLVIRLSALGDVLFALPAVHALHGARPGLGIDWVVEERAAALLELVPFVRRRIVWRRTRLSDAAVRPWRWPRALADLAVHVAAVRREEYDAILDLQGNLKSGVHALLARGDRKLGLARGHSREGGWLAARERVEPPLDALHRVEQSLAVVRAFAPEVSAVAAKPPLTVPEEAKEWAKLELDRAGFGGGAPFLVLHPGTSAFGAFKRWRPDRFGLLADVAQQKLGREAIVTFGPGEEELATKVVASSKRGAARLAPRTRSLVELAALLQRADAVVASDSLALHLAAFLGTRVVGLYGPKDPRVYGPRFAPARVVRRWLPCSPCSRRTCPDVLCMEEISVRQVYEALAELIADAAVSSPPGTTAVC